MNDNAPHNSEAEQAVIGCLLFDNTTRPYFSLAPEQFFYPVHADIWAAALDLIEQGREAGPTALLSAMRGHRGLDDMNDACGTLYLNLLWDKAPPVQVAQDMAAIVMDEWLRRQVGHIGQTAATMAFENNPRPAIDLVAHLRRQVEDLEAQAVLSEKEFEPAPMAAQAVVKNLREMHQTGRKPGKLCGLRCIDYRMGGFQPGELDILGGRPGMGKTALARAIAHGCAIRNPKEQVLFICLEMDTRRMMERELSAITYEMGEGVEYGAMARGQIDGADLATLERAQARAPDNLIFMDNSNIGLEDIRRAIFSRKRKGKIALVVIDYLQLMRRPDGRGRNDAAILGEITATLKRLARQAKCAILLLSQLSRAVESREDKRPQLSDLRESGNIEQDADFVLFAFREAYYLERSKPPAGKERDHDMRVADLSRQMEVITAKARRASVGTDLQTCFIEFDTITDRRDAA